MDRHVTEVMKKRSLKVIGNLKKRNMNGYYINEVSELEDLLDKLVEKKSTVTVGGSMTLFETGTIDYLRSNDLEFWDRYEAGLLPNEIKNLYRKSFSADYYFTSTNAITESGELYNVDGNGNRVAAMIYGPDKVIVITGVNKIVKDIAEAKERNRKIAAPANVLRLNRKTPCHTTGYCTDCNSSDKVCHAHSIISSQADPTRIHIIIINDSFGF